MRVSWIESAPSGTRGYGKSGYRSVSGGGGMTVGRAAHDDTSIAMATSPATLRTSSSRTPCFDARPHPIEQPTRYVGLDDCVIALHHLAVHVTVTVQPRQSLTIVRRAQIEFQRHTLLIQRE